MALTTRETVGILDDLDMLDLDGDSPWPGEPDWEAEQGYEIDWDGVEEALGDDSFGAQFDDPFAGDRWVEVRTAIEGSATGGARLPPTDVLDAHAWYLPIHYYGLSWGVYVRESAVFMLARAVLNRLPMPRRTETEAVMGAVRGALAVLYLHEAFHHKVESMAIRFEVVEHARRYLPYHDQVFRQLRASGSDDLLEEGLACAEMLRRLSEPVYRRSVPRDVLRATKEMVREWIPGLPPGYRRGVGLARDTAYELARNRLSSQVHEGRTAPLRPDSEWVLNPGRDRGLFNCKGVAHVLVPVGTTPIVPWFDRSALGLSFSTKDAIRALTGAGYAVVPGGKGSHVKLKKEGERRPMVLPGNRKALSMGVLKAVRDAVGASSIEALASR